MESSKQSRITLADNAPHLLIIDDDNRIRSLLSRFLAEKGFRVTTAESAEKARRTMSGINFDLLVLDVMMHGESGLEFANDIRKSSKVPILMLSARSELVDRILGLESGVDDYLAKPFDPHELLLRINAIMRRSGEANADPQKEVCFGPFVFNTERRILRKGDELIRLTERDGELLALFVSRIGETVSRKDIIGSDRHLGDRTTDVHINRLRKKIELDPGNPEYLQTVRGIGYRFFKE